MIRFEGVTKRFDNVVAVDNLNLEMARGEVTVLIGPSGCGKTTTLRMINRLSEQTEGKIYIKDEDISRVKASDLRRNIGYVIQQIGLFPQMSVAQNIGLVPYLKKWPEKKRKERIEELLELIGMPPKDYYHRHPHELSGGQQQRIGVARALAADPEIILMDEPFGAVDPITRETLQEELMKLQEEVHKTIVFVTHDMDEALKLADRIAIMKDGKVIQFDTPENLLRNPAHDYVRDFIGRHRLFQCPELISVSDVMIKDPVTVTPERRLAQAAEKMISHKVDSLLVVDRQGIFVGLATGRDIRKNVDRARKVSEIVREDLETVHKDADMTSLLAIMSHKDTGYVPVVDDDNRLIGLVTRSCIVNILGESFELECENNGTV